MSAPGTALATLHEPTPEQASRWHKPRKQPIAARLGLITDFFVEDSGAKLVKRAGGGSELLIDTGSGTSLRVTVGPDCIEVRVGPCLLREGGEPLARSDFLDEAHGIVEILQLGTGWYVYSDELIAFEPNGACPSCGVEIFEWQDICSFCESKVNLARPGEDEFDARARRVVDVLLRAEMIELVSSRGRTNVERSISTFYAYANASPETLLALFMEMVDIAEVYCDESALSRVLRRIP